MPKRLEGNLSMLFDLKAELSRKHADAAAAKASRNAQVASGDYAISSSSNKLFQKEKSVVKVAKHKVDSVSEKDRAEDEKRLQESKQKMLQKSELYDKLNSSADLSQSAVIDGSPCFLVDFERKQADQPRIPARAKSPSPSPLPFANLSSSSELLSPDMQREIERQKWEQEETKTAESGPVHYQHVLRDEVWDHGVGYYRFDKDEAKRKEQMEALEKLRAQTVEQRKRHSKLAEKRKRAMDARLAKVRERKKLKGPVPDEPEDLVSDEDDEARLGPTNVNPEEVNVIPLPGQQPEAASAFVIDKSRDLEKLLEEELKARKRQAFVRPWDEGKKKLSQEEWVAKQRAERNTEFAPPTFNY